VYVAATAAPVRILRGAGRAAALVSCVFSVLIALFSGWYLLVPVISGVCFALIRFVAGRARKASQPTTTPTSAPP
jgi:hypothetical protein